MRLESPRIAPLKLEDCNDEQRAVLEPYAKQGRLYNIFATLGNNPAALQAFTGWGGYVLRKTDLPPRDRELVILRVGYLCRAGYEWAQHSRLGKQSGLTDNEIERIKQGPTALEWDPRDRLLLEATDELLRSYFIGDPTWKSLKILFDDRQCADLVYVVAHYTQVCMILNSFGIQLDADLEADPDLSCPAPHTR
jgi:4-carboxymuconolactone decarboxylase